MSLSPVIGPYIKEPPSCDDWDPRAPDVAARVAGLITEQAPWVTPEHIGSSAVPGCAGKGIIDLLIPFGPGQLEPLKEILATLGFQRQTGPDPWPEERPMRTGSIEHAGKRYQLHVHVVPEHEPEIEELRRFRDTLRADAALRDEYVARKRAIVDSGTTNRYAYTQAKGVWIQEHLARTSSSDPASSAPSLTKTALLACVEEGRGDWERLLVQVGQERMTEPGVDGDWSVKDIVAHVAAYERWTAGQIAAATRGAEPTNMELYGVDVVPPGIDTFDMHARNAAIAAHNRDIPLDDVIATAQHAFEALVDAIHDAPEEVLTDPNALDWAGGTPLIEIAADNSYRHYDQHAPAIRAWVMQSEGLTPDREKPVAS
jgi:GrpB-like predicted nucleotidyltransferase (UPF0157 family)